MRETVYLPPNLLGLKMSDCTVAMAVMVRQKEAQASRCRVAYIVLLSRLEKSLQGHWRCADWGTCQWLP